MGRATGCITGTGNLIPKTIVQLYATAVEALEGGDRGSWERARGMQDRVAGVDWVLIKGGIPGTKYALDRYVQKGLGGVCRSPLPPVGEDVVALCEGDVLARAMEYENSL